MVAFIYRPEYYKILESSDGEDLRGLAFIDVAKCRHGSTGEAILRWHGETMSFHSLANEYNNNDITPF